MTIRWQAVFFDCDGVILDSVDVKTRAFAKLFSQHGPEIEAAVVEYHLKNGGVSRFEKFRYYYEHILKRSITDYEIEELGKAFSSLVVEEVIASPFIDGALESLEQLKEKAVPIYLVSGTPEPEMIEIAGKKGIADFFVEIHGSPQKKWDAVADLLARKGYDSSRCIFLGDAMSDYEAAKRNGMHFIGIVPEGELSVFPEGTRLMNSVPDLEQDYGSTNLTIK